MKFGDVTHPVITNKAPKNTTLSMASPQGKDASKSNNKPAPKNTSQEKKIKKEKDDLILKDQTTAPDNTSLHTENEAEKEGKSQKTTAATNENENGEGDLISNDQTTAPDNTSLHTENEAEKEGKSPKATSATNENVNGEEGKSQKTRAATNENENGEDVLISNDQTTTPDNTPLHTEGKSQKTTAATNENENGEEAESQKTTSAKNKKNNGKKSKKKRENLSRDKNVHNSLLSEPPTNKRKTQNSSSLQIHIPGETERSDGRTALSGNRLAALLNNNQKKQEDSTYQTLLPGISTNKQHKQNDSAHQFQEERIFDEENPDSKKNTQDKDENVDTKKKDKLNLSQKQDYFWYEKTSLESGASSVVMGLKGIIMVAAVVLISSSGEISIAKSCDLEKALKSISINYTVSCEYDDIKKTSTTLRDLGISLLTLNLLFFLLILVFMLLHPICKLLVCISFPFIGIFSVFMIMKYNDILYSKILLKDMNYVQLQSAMTIWLKAHYTSDNISSSDAISNSWNKFFIEYDCCAVNQVTGTTNDFDSTPWCTTSGSCQATASQIPKTCCKYMSEDDYGSAPSDCHSSVNPGTFRSNCMNVIKQLSAVNVDECQLSLLQMSLIIVATLELVATAFEITSVIIWIILSVLNKLKPEKEDNKKKENKKK